MRPPWFGHSTQEAELEALQTDIMRFMAILGLCLAAIFSLVQEAAQEQAPPAAAPVCVVHSTPDPEGAASEVRKPVAAETISKPVPTAQQAESPVAQSAQVVGFTLEFSSSRALETLVQQGQVQLLASYGDQFWQVDARGAALPVAAPSVFYQMHADTVPTHLRGALSGARNGLAITWGVTLPVQAVTQIRRLTAASAGGHLLIAADGTVTMENSVANNTATSGVKPNRIAVRNGGD